MVKILPSNAGGMGLIPGEGAKTSHASRLENQNINSRSNKKFNEDFNKRSPYQKIS